MTEGQGSESNSGPHAATRRKELSDSGTQSLTAEGAAVRNVNEMLFTQALEQLNLSSCTFRAQRAGEQVDMGKHADSSCRHESPAHAALAEGLQRDNKPQSKK